jgi:hypothetical protein
MFNKPESPSSGSVVDKISPKLREQDVVDAAPSKPLLRPTTTTATIAASKTTFKDEAAKNGEPTTSFNLTFAKKTDGAVLAKPAVAVVDDDDSGVEDVNKVVDSRRPVASQSSSVVVVKKEPVVSPPSASQHQVIPTTKTAPAPSKPAPAPSNNNNNKWHQQQNTTLQFNFTKREFVPDYIENDGLDLSKRTAKVSLPLRFMNYACCLHYTTHFV